MFEAGLFLAFVLGLATLLWYRQANARFSERILGYDATQPPKDVRALFRERPAEARRILAAWRVPSSDAETEHWRVLMHRRFRIFILIGALFLGLPALFRLVGADWQLLSRGGLFGYLYVAGLVALLGVSFFRVAQRLVAYGGGAPLDSRAISLEVARVAVTVTVAVAVLFVAAQ